MSAVELLAKSGEAAKSGPIGLAVDELFGLPHVQHGRRAAVRKQLRQPQRVSPGRERPARDLEFEILFAQLEIRARQVADERTDDLTLRPLFGEKARASRLRGFLATGLRERCRAARAPPGSVPRQCARRSSAEPRPE